MTHLPAIGLPGSLCSRDVEPTPGMPRFPAPLPPEAGRDICPECRRVLDAYSDAWTRAAARVAGPAR